MTPPPSDPDWRAVTAGLGKDEQRPTGMSRRRWRTERAAQARAARTEATDAVRRSTPVGPAAVGVLALVVLACGLLARCGASDDSAPPPSAAPAVTTLDDPVPPTTSSSSAPDATAPDAAAGAWVRAWLTRDPPADRTWRAAVQRAAPWATRELTADLRRRPDRRWAAIVSAGEITRATAARVSAAGGDLPPDAPGRVWRVVTATVDADGYVHATRTEPVTVEVMEMTSGWRVSRVLGA
ncbi:hypothetical protein ACFXJO_40455 [Streptomyces lavendulae]|uniref:hypothetical protein n=1 Tax=Streptomyces lavendulae TaxID=1914 RepID=UPI0036A5EF95